MGAQPVLVLTGKGAKTQARLRAEGFGDIPVFADLAAVVDALLAERGEA